MIVIAAVGAGVISAFLTRLLIRFSLQLGLVAKPRVERWHEQPTPNTGGLAILAAVTTVYLLTAPARYGQIFAAAVFVSLLGLLDDRIQLKPSVKFAGQSIAALALIAGGVAFQVTRWEFVNYALSFLWIVGITNAFNLIDNMDGLCAGVTVIISGFRCWLAVQQGDAACALTMAALAGGFLGFLVFNYKPAKIFMGDCGSMFAGFLLGALTIGSPAPPSGGRLSVLLYSVLTFLYPIFDMGFVSILRRAAGRPISVGGRDHSSHRLVSLGFSEQRVVWLLWWVTAIGAAAALAAYSLPFSWLILSILLTAGCALCGFSLRALFKGNHRLRPQAGEQVSNSS